VLLEDDVPAAPPAPLTLPANVRRDVPAPVQVPSGR
jgi:hypothetical protein